MPSHADKRKFDSGAEQAKRMKIEPHLNGINGFSIDSTETIDEERFFPIAVVGIGTWNTLVQIGFSGISIQHYSGIIISSMASQITGISVVYSTICSGAHKRKHQSSASLTFVKEIHRWPGTSPHKGPETRKMIPFDEVIMICILLYHALWLYCSLWTIRYITRIINPSKPSAYMCHKTTPSFVQIMACRLFGAKPLLEPILDYCQLDA